MESERQRNTDDTDLTDVHRLLESGEWKVKSERWRNTDDVIRQIYTDKRDV